MFSIFPYRARCKFSQFMPSYLKEQQAWQETLAHLFEECFNAMRHSNTELVKVQYIYAYERDLMCGSHLFQAKVECVHLTVCNPNK